VAVDPTYQKGPLSAALPVELIRAYSNKSYLIEKYSGLRKRLRALPVRPAEPDLGRRRRLKRELDRREIDEIITKYASGASTNQLVTEHRLAKRTISSLLQANGLQLRRQGLTNGQAGEAAALYRAGRSLAWIAHHFAGISPTTVARALRRQGV